MRKKIFFVLFCSEKIFAHEKLNLRLMIYEMQSGKINLKVFFFLYHNLGLTYFYTYIFSYILLFSIASYKRVKEAFFMEAWHHRGSRKKRD